MGVLHDLGLHRIELEHSTANPGSCRVATKAGYVYGTTPSDRCKQGTNTIAGTPSTGRPSTGPKADTGRVRSPAYQGLLRGGARPPTEVIVHTSTNGSVT